MGQREFPRAERVADHIQREIAELIEREVEDPRARRVTVSGVTLSRDLRSARILVTPSLGADPVVTVAALNHAAGFLRRRLAGRLRMRLLPSLTFVYDPTLDTADRVESLLAAARGPRPAIDREGTDEDEEGGRDGG